MNVHASKTVCSYYQCTYTLVIRNFMKVFAADLLMKAALLTKVVRQHCRLTVRAFYTFCWGVASHGMLDLLHLRRAILHSEENKGKWEKEIPSLSICF